MIKFFRNVRRKLISEGRVGNYIKYAIGEIVLVVLGILIALQINNWNEKKKNRDKEIIYLTRLTTNLGYDARLYDEIMKKDSILLVQMKNASSDLPQLVAGIVDPNKSLEFLISGYNFSSNRTTIDNLISSGQIEIIRSNFLLEDIFLYYRTTENIKKGVDDAISKYDREKFSPLILEFNASELKTGYAEIYTNKLKNAIDFKSSLIQRQIALYANQKLAAGKLIDKINAEIKFIRSL